MVINPGISVRSGSFSEFGLTLNFWKIPTVNRNTSILAKVAPRQFLPPNENGIIFLLGTKWPLSFICRIGSNTSGFFHKAGSL